MQLFVNFYFIECAFPFLNYSVNGSMIIGVCYPEKGNLNMVILSLEIEVAFLAASGNGYGFS